MPEQSIVAKRQSDALKLEALRLYFDFRQGRPTAESVAEKLGVSVHTVKSWLSDNANAEILDEIVPLWPNIGSARQYASEHVQEALETLVGIMRSSRSDPMRLQAANTLLALAGVRAPTGEEDKSSSDDKKPPAVLLNLFLGGSKEPIQVVDGEVREIKIEKPVRLADAVIRALPEPELSSG